MGSVPDNTDRRSNPLAALQALTDVNLTADLTRARRGREAAIPHQSLTAGALEVATP